MRQIALGWFLAGLAPHAQPDLLTQAPVVTTRCAPPYTPEARRARIEGTVVLYIEVYPDGAAHNIEVQRSLNSGLDKKAIEAVKQWRFSPGTKSGKPVVVAATIEGNFRLNDTLEPCRAGPPQIERQTAKRPCITPIFRFLVLDFQKGIELGFAEKCLLESDRPSQVCEIAVFAAVIGKYGGQLSALKLCLLF